MCKPEALEAAAARILDAFETGTLGPAIVRTLLLTGDFPSLHWSWRNRIFIALFAGHPDARGYRQWQEVGRQVRRGETAHRILAPRLKTSKKDEPATVDADTNPQPSPDSSTPTSRLVGWLSLPVFSYDQTEGEPLPEAAHAEHAIASLPLREVATAWGLRVAPIPIEFGEGSYTPGLGRIELGTDAHHIWFHELVHAADDRLTQLAGTRADREIVAEFGAQLLQAALDPAFLPDLDALDYLKGYASVRSETPLEACAEFLARTTTAVALILDTAEGLQPALAGPQDPAAGR